MEVLRIESAMEKTNISTATIYPAAIHTELLNTISDPATSAGMHALYETHGISPERIASVVAFAIAIAIAIAIEQPADTSVTEFTAGPTTQPW